MAYIPTPFTTSAVISSSTKFSQYPTEIGKLIVDVGNYLQNELVSIYAQFSSNTGYSAAVLDQGSYVSRAANILTGGGTITVSATWYVLWSARFITMGNSRGALSATAGFFDIICPVTGTITGVGGATNKTATAAGIPLDAWDTLYYILPLGSTSTSVAANFRIMGYTVDYTVPSTWIKIAHRSGDGSYVEFANDVSLRANSSINTLLYDVLGADVSGAVGSANTLATARTINGESFNGSANINIENRLGTAIASAATTTIGTKGLGEAIHITGVVTITSFGVSNTGTRRTLIFDGALTLTHNATSLICVGAANITTVAGMSVEAVCENGASGYWRILSVTHPSLSIAELGYLDGATSGIQGQLNLKSPLASPAFTGTPTVNGANISAYGQNYIINGGFDYWNYATSQTTSGYGSDDRWANDSNGSTKVHSMINATDTERALFSSSKFSRTVVTSVAGVSNNVQKWQGIENITRLAGKTITISFLAKADTNKNIAIELSQMFGTGGAPSAVVQNIGAQLVPLTSTWQKKTITISVPSIIGKTLGTDGVHTSCTYLVFWFDAGSTYNSRTASLGQQSGTFDIAEVKIEVGSVATPWTPYEGEFGGEVQACARYYYTEPLYYSAMIASSYGRHEWVFKTPMRTAPTVSYKDYLGNVGKITLTDVVDGFTNNITASAVTTNSVKTTFAYNNATSTTGMYVFSPTASAEL